MLAPAAPNSDAALLVAPGGSSCYSFDVRFSVIKVMLPISFVAARETRRLFRCKSTSSFARCVDESTPNHDLRSWACMHPHEAENGAAYRHKPPDGEDEHLDTRDETIHTAIYPQ
eukprot:CAMPEP_0181201594 /NCGR_PEP_ID=MMETSP1096-20121128/18389_1 /TAXON_ID=156174 ORGANISM="Chrysochromulina ericina, Strain CCMP281" /NCGR_SAMPLE_ID=MMETSP1096 /ASSEMBLY_ACC=CAM_ASM_000453 /LENGTH=114 /DNA_ID=CAMNT_0023292045 /DNA_START=304 /DNA_END=649 /DNA_ORIENTATION=+